MILTFHTQIQRRILKWYSKYQKTSTFKFTFLIWHSNLFRGTREFWFFMFKLLKRKNVFILTCLISVFALSVSCFAEYILNIAPCELCLISRGFYLSMALFSCLALKTQRDLLSRALLFIVFLGLVFGYFHLGVESHWWAGPKGCVSELPTLDNLKQAVQENVPYCDKVNFTIFKISSTLWNVFLMSFLFWIISISEILNLFIRKQNEE